MSNEKFDADVIVIGAGPGGYVAAIKAAQLGASVICVEKSYLGGCCLNYGCIPSKVWISQAERFQNVQHASDLGVKLSGKVEADYDAMYGRVEKIVKVQRGGVDMLFKKNQVKYIAGTASFLDAHTIEVKGDNETTKIRGNSFIIATGSRVMDLKIPGLEGKNVWTSDDAVLPPFLPKSILVIGGGAVGVEFGYVFNALGAETTVVEMMPTLLPMFDEELGQELQKSFKRQGINVLTGSTVENAKSSKEGWTCTIKGANGTTEVKSQVVLVAVGRAANIEGLNLEKVGVRTHKRGIEVANDHMQTHVPHIYAIGDVIGKIQLAHVASAEGIVAAHNAVAQDGKIMDYKAIPNCVYTHPEVASVGMTEGEAKAAGYDVVIGKFGFRANGKAMASAEQDGFVKVVAEKKYGEVLGAHIIGAHATDLIHEAVAAINLEATLEYMCDMIHAHPTLAEPIHEAFEVAAFGKSIHTL